MLKKDVFDQIVEDYVDLFDGEFADEYDYEKDEFFTIVFNNPAQAIDEINLDKVVYGYEINYNHRSHDCVVMDLLREVQEFAKEKNKKAEDIKLIGLKFTREKNLDNEAYLEMILG